MTDGRHNNNSKFDLPPLHNNGTNTAGVVNNSSSGGMISSSPVVIPIGATGNSVSVGQSTAVKSELQPPVQFVTSESSRNNNDVTATDDNEELFGERIIQQPNPPIQIQTAISAPTQQSSTRGTVDQIQQIQQQQQYIIVPPQLASAVPPVGPQQVTTQLQQQQQQQQQQPYSSVTPQNPKVYSQNYTATTISQQAPSHEMLSRPVIQRNASLPNVSVPQQQQQQVTLSPPNHEAVTNNGTNSGSVIGPTGTIASERTIVNSSNTAGTNGQQVVTIQKGRFKFVEQIPVIQQPQPQPQQRSSTSKNDVTVSIDNSNNLDTNQQRQQIPIASIAVVQANNNINAQIAPPPPPPSLAQQQQSSFVPPASIVPQHPDGQSQQQQQVPITTPSVQKKGRFVVTTLPLPTALNASSGVCTTTAATTTTAIGGLQQPSTQHNSSSQQQLHTLSNQQFQTLQQQHQPIADPTLQQTGMKALAIEAATHVRRPSDGGASVSMQQVHSNQLHQVLLSNYIPSNGTSPGHSMTQPHTNSENSSPIATLNMNIDESFVQGATVQYDSLQQSSSRQASPKTISKPNAYVTRHNTTGMSITPPPPPAIQASVPPVPLAPGIISSSISSNTIATATSNAASLLPTPIPTTTTTTITTSQQQQQQQPPRSQSFQPPHHHHQQQQPVGFGKMLYFLDQMKLEVTEADHSIKSLQTDMKCLKEKNKELEAKARDMERKWNQEKALREVAETRVKALKKKLRTYENSSINNGTMVSSSSSLMNDTSIDGIHVGPTGTATTTTTTTTATNNKDDESVGTNQTYEKYMQQHHQQQQYSE